jgi:TRAP-type C4-dicarboxylate transport system substrate-binding protein
MSFAEVYSALQQGVIDGAETGMVDLLVEKFYEVTKYVSYTRHLVSGSIAIFSKKTYDKLPPHVQVAVLTAARAGAQAFRDDEAAKTEVAFQELKKLGLEFNEVDRQSFVDKISDLYEEHSKKLGGLEAIEQVQAQ